MTNPPRSKTHSDPVRVAEILKMDRIAKMLENADIKGRNMLRAYRRKIEKGKGTARSVTAEGSDTMAETGSGEISDDESIITVPEEANPPPPPRPEPTTIEGFLNAIASLASKRSASPPVGGDLISGSKRIRLASAVESTSGIGEIEEVTVPNEVWDLHNSGCYTTLGLFTMESIRTLQDSAHTIKGVKAPIPLDAYGAKFGTTRVINVNSPGLTQEHNMSEPQWGFASKTMTLWSKRVKSDLILYNWLFNHFRWTSATRLSSGIDFNTMLAFDIHMRKKYHRAPFAFSAQRWQMDLMFFIQQREMEIRNRKDQETDSRSFRGRQDGQQGSSSSSYQTDSSKGKKSFRSGQTGGNGGGNRPPTCTLCLTEGHKVGECRATKRVDGKGLYAKVSADGKCLLSLVGNAVICLAWNIFGRASKACNSHDDNPAAHRCSACGSPEHHALAFACLKKN
jgi:hypothetical protein